MLDTYTSLLVFLIPLLIFKETSHTENIELYKKQQTEDCCYV